VSSQPPDDVPDRPQPPDTGRPTISAAGYLDDLWDTDDPDEPDDPAAQSDDSAAQAPSGPNYRARRTLMVAALAVAAGVAAVVAYSTFGNGDEALVIEPLGWNALVEVDRASGLVSVIDTAGNELDTIATSSRVNEIIARGSRLGLVGPDTLSLVDVDSARSVAVELERRWNTTALSDTDSLTLMSAPAATGGLLIIDGASGQQIDVARAADQRNPLLLADSIRSDPAGRSFAIGDGRNFQTLVVSFDALEGIDDEVVFFPGVPLAISGDLVVTSANVGQSAELGLFDRNGERREAISTERPVGGVIDGDRFVYVTETGRVLSARSGSPEELGVVPVPGSDDVREVAAVAGGARIMVSGDRFSAVVTLDGELLHQSARPAGQIAPRPHYSWRCAPVFNNAVVSIIDLIDGSTVGEAQLDGAPPADREQPFDSVSADGCAVSIGDRIVSARGSTTLVGDIRSVSLAPDGTAAAITARSGAAGLLIWAQRPSADQAAPADEGAGSDSGEVSLGNRPGLIGFVEIS